MTVILTFFIITCAPLRSARHDVGNEEIVHLYASLGRDARVKKFALSGMSNALNSSLYSSVRYSVQASFTGDAGGTS